jgi:hypothetical protein
MSDRVFVNGHGPYRFLLDTGTNLNLIETTLARSLGMTATFRTELESSTGAVSVSGVDTCVIRANSAEADRQLILISDLQAIRKRWPGVQGVLGQAFLSRFDYMFRRKGSAVEFGAAAPDGVRIPFRQVNGRTAIDTTLGTLVLDSGADKVVLFHARPETPVTGELRTLAGVLQVGLVARTLVISGRRIWSGDAIAIPHPSEAGVDGLVPLNLFRNIYVCNSSGYVVFE